jgi:cell division protein FtsL
MEEGGIMRSHSGTIRLALAFAALLGALTMVIYRQSRALEVLRVADEMRSERVIAEAERAELARRIQTLQSRSRVVTEARTRLGMHVPSAHEIVILPLNGTATPASAPAPAPAPSIAGLP